MAKVIALELEKNYLLLVLLESDFHSAPDAALVLSHAQRILQP